jgi:hypothetical protein
MVGFNSEATTSVLSEPGELSSGCFTIFGEAGFEGRRLKPHEEAFAMPPKAIC